MCEDFLNDLTENYTYSIPENIKILIDKEFLITFKNKLDELYPINSDGISNVLTEYHYRNLESSGTWEKALLNTCFDLKKLQVLGYWESLEWYDSDSFDDLLVDMLIDSSVIDREVN